MNTIPYEQRPYRLNVGIMIFNKDGLIFTGRRIKPADAWQMPQGGIDPDEDPLLAAKRELLEETGIESAEYIGETTGWLTYNLPIETADDWWNGQYRGQQQKWFLFFFSGTDSDIDLNKHEQEFAEWQWSTPELVLERIIEFKKDIYTQVLSELYPLVRKHIGIA